MPKGLLAAGIISHGRRDDPLRTIALANEILALYGRPLITDITVPQRAVS
ncbi:hypothetical protein ACWIG2_16475 [Streptomyces cellulosae]